MKQIIFSAIKPSGSLHIGNYLGAIKQFVKLQEEAKAIFCIVDLHAITVPQNAEDLRRRSFEVAAIYLACGIDPIKSLIFVQSHVPAHTELGWILNTFTPLGELQRMTQYKDAIAKGKPAFAGLLNYPTLMAADILLYQTTRVPVGQEQLQHLELTRSIAERFNNKYGNTFTIPVAVLEKYTARILSVAHPSQKMSKSELDKNGTIEIMDSEEQIRQKIKTAVTDSGTEITYDPKSKPALSNLIAIYSGFSNKSISEIEKNYHEKKYAEFKKDLAEIIIAGLKPIQEKFQELSKNKNEVKRILKNGATEAQNISSKTLTEVKNKIGIL